MFAQLPISPEQVIQGLDHAAKQDANWWAAGFCLCFLGLICYTLKYMLTKNERLFNLMVEQAEAHKKEIASITAAYEQRVERLYVQSNDFGKLFASRIAESDIIIKNCEEALKRHHDHPRS